MSKSLEVMCSHADLHIQLYKMLVHDYVSPSLSTIITGKNNIRYIAHLCLHIFNCMTSQLTL